MPQPRLDHRVPGPSKSDPPVSARQGSLHASLGNQQAEGAQRGEAERSTGDLRSELGLPPECILVNAGSWGPLCRVASEAMVGFHAQDSLERIDWERYAGKVLGHLADDRLTIANFVGAEPEEIALCDSTTTAMNIVLWGLDLRAGDEVLYSNLENPALEIALWVLAQRREVKLTKVDLGLGERNAVEAFGEKMSARSRLMVVSDINYATGARVDLAGLGQLAQKANVFLLADGVQALGTVPIHVGALNVDAYAMARHKFACGPDGAGALYVRRERLNEVSSTFAGVCSTTMYSSEAPPPGTYALRSTAERFEVSTRDFGAFLGGTAALRWLVEDVGLDFIYGRTTSLRTRLWDKLSGLEHVHMISRRDWPGALLTFWVDKLPSPEVVRRLAAQGIFARTIEVTQPASVRLSMGFWNDDNTIDTVVGAIQHLSQR